jgi:ADP-ribose pyrophosphatase
MDLKETRIDSAVVYEGDFIKVLKDNVRLPDGSVSTREHISHPGAVAVLALLDNGNLLTGYVASEWTHLATTWPCIGYANERMEYFLARGLSHRGSQLDDGEFLEVLELSLVDALEWIRQGRINDSKSIVGLFWLEKTLSGWTR